LLSSRYLSNPELQGAGDSPQAGGALQGEIHRMTEKIRINYLNDDETKIPED
jgi:hypothetical protein